MTFYPMIPVWILACAFVFSIIFFAGKSFKKILLVSIIFGLLFLINFRGKMNTSTVNVKSSNFDILFVIDNSLSMSAEDFDGNGRRIDAVANDVEKIINKFPGSKYGLISFNVTSRVVCPYTSDANLIKSYVKSCDMPSSTHAKGTNIGAPIELMKDVLKNYKSNGDRKRVVFFISDGEVTDGKEVKSFSTIKQYINYAFVLGYGTSKGGKMLYPGLESYYGSPNYLKDYRTYRDGISKINEGNLKKVASDLGGQYIHIVNNSSIDGLLNNLEKQAVFTDNGETAEEYNDTYFYFAVPLLIVLTIVFVKIKKSI